MNTNRNIVRQVRDIQARADHLINTSAGLTEIEQFSDYNKELKSFLIKTIKDDFIFNYIKEIPELEISESETKKGFFYVILYFIFGSLGLLAAETKQINDSLDTIRDIKGKYASVELLLSNNFD
ncbi:hypothetical protein ABN763_02070 [Spongiivirga sp. MCCC 1A20706]|uniref:hypothetical protein n=1 Tax=Spongiivirga sp. MCCC 1A20706 TaxID=3160963 RepID=UPI00397730FD